MSGKIAGRGPGAEGAGIEEKRGGGTLGEGKVEPGRGEENLDSQGLGGELLSIEKRATKWVSGGEREA